MIASDYIRRRVEDLGINDSVVDSVSHDLEGLPKEYVDSVVDTLRATYIDQRTKISV